MILFSIHDLEGVKVLLGVKFNFSNLKEHKVRQNFEDYVNTMSICRLEIGSVQQFYFHCHCYHAE